MNVVKKLKLLLCLVVLVSLVSANTLLVIQTHAQEETTTSNTDSAEAGSTNPKKTLAERLTERKEKLQTKLTDAQQTRLKARCKASQGLLNSFHTRVKGIEKNRTALYQKIADKLNDVVAKVGDHADTTQLKAQITELETKSDAFEADIAEYKQAISDLVEMDCAVDPTAFRASLDQAKTLRAELLQTSKDIREYINDNIKTTLQAIRTELEENKTGETN